MLLPCGRTGGGALNNAAISHPSVCPMLCAQMVILVYDYYKTLTGNCMLDVEPTGHCGRMVTGSGQNGNRTIASTAAEAFTMWLHH